MIVGGGPAGLAASVYAARKQLNTLLISVDIGGQVNNTLGVENYLGYQFIEGPELIDKFHTQVSQFPIDQKIGYKVSRLEKIEGGFEVIGISLDQERDALEKFVADRKIPWPILFEPSEGAGWQHPLATYYGISGIPTVILIGMDGNVVSLNARGERLGELLDELYKDSSNAGGS